MKKRLIDVLTAATGCAIIFGGYKLMSGTAQLAVYGVGVLVAALGVPQASGLLEKYFGKAGDK